MNPNCYPVSSVKEKDGRWQVCGPHRRPAREYWVSIMESSEFVDNPWEGSGPEPERSKLLVKRAAYQRFNRWMDEQLAGLVARWARRSITRRITPPIRRRKP